VTRTDMVIRLRDPHVREVLTRVGVSPGTVVDLVGVQEELAVAGYFLPPVLAADRRFGGPRPGWNLCCNRCGTYGATWTTSVGERAGWGSLALCPTHQEELAAEHRRHAAALEALRTVRYEQPRRH
jgi:hypothetical protein